ncbi:MAG TPA: GNAT family N-acetyltransferase [Gemmatimonadales bacterium]|nr:GNAT family N-acetyltransferase [Gemmatimonadales bacterium]
MADVLTWRADYREAFERLNREWIETYFAVEPSDLAVFRDPEGAIVRPGGQIFFVVDDAGVRGTCALLPHAPGVLELAKMAVSPAAQGKGYGELLMRAAIGYARERGVRKLMLVSNTGLAAAIGLYRKCGFREVPIERGIEYARADIQMELDLTASRSE